MKNHLLSFAVLLAASFSFAQTAAAQAELPWAKEWARTISIKKTGSGDKKLKIEFGFTKKAFLGSAFAEINGHISKMTGAPNSFITPEFMNFYMGYTIIGMTDYAAVQEDFVIDDELVMIKEKSAAGTLKKEDFKNKRRWIHIVNAIDKEEINCTSISVVNGVLGGCGDIWQNGISDDEVVCHNDYNYLKCHVDCMNKLYNRKADVTSGFCPENK